MSFARATTLAVVALPIVPACSFVDELRYTAAEIAGRAIVIECSLSMTERAANLSAITGWLATNNHTPRALALDCNGDGTADF